MANSAMPAAPSSNPPDRRLIAVGMIRQRDGRTPTVRATATGITGSIRPTGGTR